MAEARSIAHPADFLRSSMYGQVIVQNVSNISPESSKMTYIPSTSTFFTRFSPHSYTNMAVLKIKIFFVSKNFSTAIRCLVLSLDTVKHFTFRDDVLGTLITCSPSMKKLGDFAGISHGPGGGWVKASTAWPISNKTTFWLIHYTQ